MTQEYKFDTLISKIEQKKAELCIVGLGQVGLPTAVAFLNNGFKVSGFDINQDLVNNLKKGKSRITDPGFQELVLQFIYNGLFRPTSVEDILSDMDVIVVCVPTPLESDNTANLGFLQNALETIAKHLKNQKLIVVESTLPPKTMQDSVIPLLERVSSRKAGEDFLVSFCPERIAPGNALHEFTNNARLIGANDGISHLASLKLYKDITNGGLHHTDTTTAEISKLAENSFRDINIAFANELAIICKQANVDVMEVIRLANTHPRVNIHRPGAGVGGPCLPKDPYFLLMGARLERSVVRMARTVNDTMPIQIVDLLMNHMTAAAPVNSLNTLVLGTAYKPDVNDSRYSPAQSIITTLYQKGFTNINVHDPYSEESFGARYVKDLKQSLVEADCVIIATGHRLYSSITSSDFKKGAIIIDAPRILKKENVTGISYIEI